MPVDLLLDENYDLQIRNGDWVFGECTLQNQRLLLIGEKMQYKQFPLTCVGLGTFLLEDLGPDELKREIQNQIEADGARIVTLNIDRDYDAELESIYPES